jgi:hypothetical protein
MAAVPVEITGMLYDLLNKSSQRVVLLGNASIFGLSVGGGPIFPPDQPPPGGPPGHPEHPIWGPPGISLPPGPGFPPVAGHPLPIPPGPNVPPPGSPPVVVGGTQPVQPMVPPAAVVIEYPGIGKVVVPQPTATVDIPIGPGGTPPA